MATKATRSRRRTHADLSASSRADALQIIGSVVPRLGRNQQETDAILITSVSFIRPMELDGVSLHCPFYHIWPGRVPTGYTEDDHAHPLVQIEYAVEGTFAFTDARGRQTFQAGEGLVIPPHRVHRWECVKRGMLLGVDVAISGPAKDAFLEDMRRTFGHTMKRFDGAELAMWTAQVFTWVVEPAPYVWRRNLIGDFMHAWLATLFKQVMDLEAWRKPIPFVKDSVGDRDRRLVQQALDCIQANYGKRIRVADVARQVGISARHLSRLFREYQQDSVNTVIMRTRLARARQLLLSDPTLTIQEVAYACGFNQPSYFTKCFREMYGQLPTNLVNHVATITTAKD